MAICDYCKKEMMDSKTISCKFIKIKMKKGKSMNPLTFLPPEPSTDRCRDCGVLTGGFHHRGCCIEVCPKCEGQLISCECLK